MDAKEYMERIDTALSNPPDEQCRVIATVVYDVMTLARLGRWHVVGAALNFLHGKAVAAVKVAEFVQKGST